MFVAFAFEIKVSIKFENKTMKLSLNKAKLTGLWASNCATYSTVLNFWPEKFLDLSRKGPQTRFRWNLLFTFSSLKKRKGGTARKVNG